MPIRALEESCFTSDQMSLRSIQRLICSTSARVVVAEAGDILAGAAVLLLRRKISSARLYSLAVAPEHRGLGVATAMLQSLEHAAAASGTSSLRLELREDNRTAAKLYLRNGFRKMSQTPGYYADGATALRLAKPLQAAAQ